MRLTDRHNTFHIWNELDVMRMLACYHGKYLIDTYPLRSMLSQDTLFPSTFLRRTRRRYVWVSGDPNLIDHERLPDLCLCHYPVIHTIQEVLCYDASQLINHWVFLSIRISAMMVSRDTFISLPSRYMTWGVSEPQPLCEHGRAQV